MLALHSSNRVTFNVNVQGTATLPTVRVFVGADPGLSFEAQKIIGDDLYEVIIDLPHTMGEGAHPFRVEVLLNGRLFTPIKTTIQVMPDEVVATEKTADAIPVTQPVAVEQEPAVQPVAEEPDPVVEQEAVAKEPEVIVPKPTIAKDPVVTAKIKTVRISMADIANEAARKEPETPSAAKAPKQRVQEQIKTIPLTLTKGDIIYR